MRSGWEKTTLGAAFVTVTGNTPPKNNPDLYGTFMPLVKPPELCDAYLDSAEDGLSETGVLVARTAPPNSILVSCIGNLGKVGLNLAPVAFNQQINAVLMESGKTIPEFMFYQVLSARFKEQLEALASGTTIPIVNKSRFNSIEIVLPPLPEQHRIVGILDEAFNSIATAKANTEKNLQNARALFESHLQSVFTQRGEGWVETTIGGQIILQRGFDITKDQQSPGVVPVVSSGGIKSFHNTAMVKAPGVVIGRKGTLGKVFYMERDFWPHDTTLWVKEFKGNHPRFVYHFLAALDVTKLNSGTANPALNRNQVHPIVTSWPSVDRQRTIALTLDSLLDETQRLESIYQRKVVALEELKKSLLHKAFSGEL
jgi:type I restriction enzyme, S subunit